jgi:hypothetical protein
MKLHILRGAILVAGCMAALSAVVTSKDALGETRRWGLVAPGGGTFGMQDPILPRLRVQPRGNVVPDYVLGGPVSLPCLLRGGELIWIENATGVRLRKGTPVRWQTSAGEQGTEPLPHDIDPSLPIGLLRVNDAQTCAAQVVMPRPVLAR